MKSYLSRARSYINREKSITISFLILSMVLMTGAVSAATTISTDITTGGYLSVTGTATTSSFAGSLSVGTSSNFMKGLFSVGTSSPLFYVDKLSGYLGIGTASPVTQLHVAGNSAPSLVATVTGLGLNPTSISIQGSYAYVVNVTTPYYLTIFDISNPLSPRQISQTVTDGQNKAVSVQGKYAYVTVQSIGGSTGELQIFDISSSSAPVSVGKITSWSGFPMTSMYVRGSYIYGQYSYNKGAIIDISNPFGTGNIVSSRVVGYFPGSLNSTVSAIDVSGKYLYMVGASGILEIYDVSNVSSAQAGPFGVVLIGSVTATTGGNMGMVKIMGRYAYVVNNDANQLQVFDVSNPAIPTQVNSTNLATVDNAVATFKLAAASDISIQGRYAYITSQVSNKLQVFDISSSTNPVSVGSVATGVDPLALAIKGRYAYVLNNTDSSMQVFDLGGAYIQQLEVGGLGVGSFAATDNAQFGKDLKINGGLTVGYSALFNSSLAVTSSNGISTTTTFIASPNGYVGIGIPTPSSPLQVVAPTTNATTTVEIGRTGQGKGSCLVLYDAAGTAVYAYVAAGATTFTLSATSCK